jgi:hypothetical protein
MKTVYPEVAGVTFKEVPGFPAYCVGDDGSVWTRHGRMEVSKDRVRWPRKSRPAVLWGLTDTWTRKRLSRRSPHGHLGVRLFSEGKARHFAVHELVLLVFVGPRPNGYVACHFPDRDPTNNRLENLRWDTYKANEADAFKHGTRIMGERVYSAKLNENAVREIRDLMRSGVPSKEVGQRYGVHYTTVNKVVAGVLWSHVDAPAQRGA